MHEPPSIPAHARLAEAETCRRRGDLGRAQSLCEALLKEHPDYVGALQTLGVIHLARKNHQQAFICFIQAVMHCPKDGVNQTNLATACLRLGAREMAAQALEQARRLNPEDAVVYSTLAEIHRENREYELAAQCYRKVQELLPAQAAAAHGLGDCYNHLGRGEEAAAALERAHRLNPNSVAILYALGQLPASATGIDLLSALDRVHRQEAEEKHEFETCFAFTRAAALDRQKRHREAWTSAVAANLREFPQHEAAHRRHAVRMEAALQAARDQPVLACPPRRDPVSLFIIGPSRSGKSTLEHLARRLEGVKRGHESRLVERAVRRTAQISGILTTADANDLPLALDGRLRDVYARELQDFAPGARIITDTYPAIISYVGRIATAIPQTRFVFMKREHDDLALRIFMKHYRSGNHYAYDIKTIFEHLSWYDRMTDAWLEKLPGLALRIDYREMIAEPGAALGRVAELCDVPVVSGALPQLTDDRDCALPYRKFIAAAR
ncbi:MAG: sulfotransferase [Pseudomonadota bacterium]|nr:sulfotransferase [Pseudomonadota bacterium]